MKHSMSPSQPQGRASQHDKARAGVRQSALDSRALPHPARPAPGAACGRAWAGRPRTAAPSNRDSCAPGHSHPMTSYPARCWRSPAPQAGSAWRCPWATSGWAPTHRRPGPKACTRASAQVSTKPPQDTRHAAGGLLGATGGQQLALPARTHRVHMQDAASALRLLRRPGAAGGRAWKAARSRGAREWRDGRGLPELLPGLPHDLCFQDPDPSARRHPCQQRAGARDERERAARPAAVRGAG